MIGFGIRIRTYRIQVFDISFFNITEETESFLVEYDELDTWNSTKKLKVDVLLNSRI
jgi:hypothetical protein